MTQLGAVRVSVTVPVDPGTAFVVFTEEIDQWYRKGLSTLGAASRSATMRIEPGCGGRLVEELASGRRIVRGQITTWQPGARLVFVDARGTEVDVRFEPVPDGTRVVLEHRGLDELPPDLARSAGTHGWRRLAGWFERHIWEGERWQPNG